MKYFAFTVIILILVALVVLGMKTTYETYKITDDPSFAVLLPYNPDMTGDYGYILDAYESVLEEEGVPTQRINIHTLLRLDPERLATNKPVVIFGDGITQSIPLDVRAWTMDYMAAGGNIAAIFDAGVKGFGIVGARDKVSLPLSHIPFQDEEIERRPIENEPTLEGDVDLHPDPKWGKKEDEEEEEGAPAKVKKGQTYLVTAPFTHIVGVEYGLYNELKERTYTRGKVKVPDTKRRDYLQLPPGKFDEEGYLSGYIFGALTFPVARVRPTDLNPESEVFAEIVLDNGETYPGVVIREFEQGKALYVNLPLGYLKAFSDDLLLRTLMRVFLFDEIGIPHLQNTPEGKAGLVVNWHVDDRTEWLSLPKLMDMGFFKPGIEHSFHITAGDFVDEPGDAYGFDACGKGAELTKRLTKYGAVGSHGGWGHNWFAHNVNAKLFSAEDIREQIVRNSECIEKETNIKVTEYSAPNGAFPQPENNEILKDLGFVAYYNTADSGSAPTRTFVEGVRPLDDVFSFPIMPYRKAASLYEMQEVFELNAENIRQWLEGTLDYVLANRTIRLVYSHTYDLVDYLTSENRQVVFDVFDHMSELHDKGELLVKPMTYFAEFLRRFVKTDFTITRTDDGYEYALKNGDGLQQITLAVPENCKVEDTEGLKLVEDDHYHLLVIEKQIDEITVDVHCN